MSKDNPLQFFQSPGRINLPSVFYVNGKRTERVHLKKGPKPK